MSLHFTKFGLSHVFQNQIDGYTGKLLNYMFDSFSCTSAVVNMTTNTFIRVNSNLTDESMKYLTSLAPYSDSNDLLSYLYTNSNIINFRETDKALDYASNNNLELIIFASFEGAEFGFNPTVKRNLLLDAEEEIQFDSDIIEIGGGGAERKMLLASNFNKPLFSNILKYYISSFVNYNYNKYGTIVNKYIIMNESRTTNFRLPRSANQPNMWHKRGMLKILGEDFIPFFFKAYDEALPDELKNTNNCLYYMDADTEFRPVSSFRDMIDDLTYFKEQKGAPIHGYGFQAHCGDLLARSFRGPRDLKVFESNINYVRQSGFNTIIQEYDGGASREWDGETIVTIADSRKLETEINFNNTLVHISMNHGAQHIHNWYVPWGEEDQFQFINVCNIPIYGRSNRPTPIFKELHKFVKWYKTYKPNSFNSLVSVYDYSNRYVGVFPSLKQVALSNNLTDIKFGIIVNNDEWDLPSRVKSQFATTWRMDSIKYAYDIIVPPNCMKMAGLRDINNNTDSLINLGQFTNILGPTFNSNRSFTFNGRNANINTQLFSNDINAAANAIANYASNNNLKVRGHTLCWHTQQPRWLINMANKRILNFDTAQTILSNHVTTVIRHYYSRYSNTVTSWDVINELIVTGTDEATGNPRIRGGLETIDCNDISVRGRNLATIMTNDGRTLSIINCNCLGLSLRFPATNTSRDDTVAEGSEVFRIAFNSAWSATPANLRSRPSLFYNDFRITDTTLAYLNDIRGNYRTGRNPFVDGGIAIDGIGYQGYIRTGIFDSGTNSRLRSDLSNNYNMLCSAKNYGFAVDITETVVDIVSAGESSAMVNKSDYDNKLYAKVYRNWLRLSLYAGVNNFISWENRMFDSNGNPSLYYNEIVNEVRDFPADKYGSRSNFNNIPLITMDFT